MALAAIGSIGILAGLVTAAMAARFPPHRTRLEHWGGGLFLGGLVLVALGVPMI